MDDPRKRPVVGGVVHPPTCPHAIAYVMEVIDLMYGHVDQYPSEPANN